MNNLDNINEFKKTADTLSKMMKDIKLDDHSSKLQLKFKNPNKTYEMKCINCRSTNIYMHNFYELQKCDDCKLVYMAKELEMK